MTGQSKDTIYFIYKLKLDNGIEKDFQINLDKKTLSLISEPRESFSPWMELTIQKCPNCPLNESEHKHCPIAINMTEIIDFFGNLMSIEQANIFVETKERQYSKRTDLQSAVSSLIGIIMVTSGCPIMDKLRPMVRFHLPFASSEETTYRALSMYLLAQFLIYKENKNPDWDLKDLAQIYAEINKVNSSFSKRLKESKIEDATLNAVVKLDCFAQFVGISINDELLDDIKAMYHSYLA